MRPCRGRWLVLVLLVPMGACSQQGEAPQGAPLQEAPRAAVVSCSAERRPGIVVEARLAGEGTTPAPVTFVVRQGASVVDSGTIMLAPTPRASSSGPPGGARQSSDPAPVFGAAAERAGVFDVTVSSPRYETVTWRAVRVHGDACHVQTVRLKADLKPAPRLTQVSRIVANARSALRISGDTTGTPAGCSVDAAITALDGWFRAISSGDTSAVRTHVASDHGAFSVMPFSPGHRFWRGDTNEELMEFLRRRARAHDTLTLRGIVFFGWLPKDVRCRTCERRTLGFMPDYERKAGDLPPGRHRGTGKGGYQCQRGLLSLNLGPRPG